MEEIVHLSTRAYIFLFTILLLFACNDPQARRDSFYSKAMEYYQEENYDDALVEIKNVLRIDPRFSSGYVLLGNIALKKNSIKNAYQNFSKGYDLDPGSRGANLGLATCYLQGKEYERAHKYIQAVLDDFPDDPKVHYLQSLLLNKQGHYKDALKIARRLLTVEKSRDIFFLIANSYYELKEKDRAIQTLQDAIAVFADDVVLHLELARMYELSGDLISAEKEYIYLSKIKNLDDLYKYVLVNFYMRNNENSKAKSFLQSMIDAKKNDDAFIVFAEILMKEGHYKKVRTMLMNNVKDNPSNFHLKFYLAKFYISQNELKSAIQTIQELLKDDQSVPKKIIYRKKLASIYQSQNTMQKMREQMSLVLESAPRDSDALMFFAHESVKNGSINNAILQFRQVIQQEPLRDRAYVGLATAYLALGDTSLAVQTLAECIGKNGSTRSRFLLVRIFEGDGRFTRAIEQLEALNEKDPSDILITKHLTLLYLKEGKFSEAEKRLVHCVDLSPDSIAPRLILADFYRLTKQFSRAHGEVDTILAKNPTNILGYEEKIKIFHSEKKDQQGFVFIKKNIQDVGTKKYLLAELYAMNQEYVEAEKYYTGSLVHEPKNMQAYYKLATIYLGQKEYAKGIAVCRKMIDLHLSDGRSNFLLGYFYQLDMQYEKATVCYKKVLEESPAFFPAANNLAYIYAEKFPSKANLDHALELMVNFSGTVSTESMDTLAWIYTRRGDFNKSIPILEKLSSRSDISPLIYYHLGMSYLESGDKGAARIWLVKSIASEKQFAEKSLAKKVLKALDG